MQPGILDYCLTVRILTWGLRMLPGGTDCNLDAGIHAGRPASPASPAGKLDLEACFGRPGNPCLNHALVQYLCPGCGGVLLHQPASLTQPSPAQRKASKSKQKQGKASKGKESNEKQGKPSKRKQKLGTATKTKQKQGKAKKSKQK